MHMLMQSASLIVTPLRTSICKPMNWLEVSRIAGIYTDLCKNFLGEDPQTPPFQYNSSRLSTINTMQVILLYLFIYKKNMHYTFILLYMYIYIALHYAFATFFFFAFHFLGKKNCAPPTFSSLSYAVENITRKAMLIYGKWKETHE